MSRVIQPLESYREERHRRRVHKGLAVFLAVLALIIVAYLAVARSGRWLVKEQSFGHLPWVVILDGQSADLERDDFAADLMTQGRADSVLILGRRVFRDKSNADFYAEDFMRSGTIDAGRVYVFRHDDPSSIAEARSIIPWLKSRAAGDTILLLTDAAATRRVNAIFNRLSNGHPVFITCDIHNYRYNADNWWGDREARKKWAHEWAAMLLSKWDLLNADTVAVDPERVVPAECWKPGKLQTTAHVERLVPIASMPASPDTAK